MGHPEGGGGHRYLVELTLSHMALWQPDQCQVLLEAYYWTHSLILKTNPTVRIELQRPPGPRLMTGCRIQE